MTRSALNLTPYVTNAGFNCEAFTLQITPTHGIKLKSSPYESVITAPFSNLLIVIIKYSNTSADSIYINKGGTMSLPRLKKGTRIYDLLKEAGMELNHWAHANDPSKNTFWAWIEGDIAVVSIWEDNIIVPTLPDELYYTRYVARGRKGKGNSVDDIYKAIIKHRLPVHVLIKHRDKQQRILDPIAWRAAYDSTTGELTLTRGNAISYIDQKGSLDPEPTTDETPVTRRSKFLRKLAMERSHGECEYCGKPGFRTSTNAIFAEVHHIVPLKENGLDILSNLIVLCPNDHRRAHYADNAAEMKLAFIKTRKANPTW